MKKVLDWFKNLSLKWKLTILFFVYTILSSLVAYFNSFLVIIFLGSFYVCFAILGLIEIGIDYYFADRMVISELIITCIAFIYSYFISFLFIFFIKKFNLKINKLINKLAILILFIILSWLFSFLLLVMLNIIDPSYFD